LLVLGFIGAPSGVVFGEASLSLTAGDTFTITRRQDIRTWEDGHYVGFRYRQVKVILQPFRSTAYPSYNYSGRVYQFEQTRKNSLLVSKRVDDTGDVFVHVDPQGNITGSDSAVLPLSGFPTLPTDPVSIGETWRSSGLVRFYPSGKQAVTLPILCEYKYRGVEEERHAIESLYAIRFKAGDPDPGDPTLLNATGSHRGMIYLPEAGGESALIKEQIRAKFDYTDGTSSGYDGIILTWLNAGLVTDHGSDGANVTAEIESSGIRDTVVEETDEGVTLRIMDIHFVSDSPDVLPDERERIERIAEVLSTVPRGTFLVTGHTAAVGTRESQLELSVLRAKRIVDMLVERGLPASRFAYRGKGGDEPIGDNTTDEGRKQNRRVEITILRD